MRTRSLWRRVANGRWVFLGSRYALEYCPINCHYLVFREGQPLFQVLTLAEADEALHDLLEAGEL